MTSKSPDINPSHGPSHGPSDGASDGASADSPTDRTRGQGAGRFRQDWLSRKILFVSGKGGVGKSAVAAAAAREAAKDGRRVLLAELGETSYFKDLWGLPKAGHDPIRAPGGFDLALWSGETCLREYVLHYLRLERLYAVFFENKVMRALMNVAPGLPEIAIMGKATSGLRRVGPPLDYDLIVIDAYATGHALALLRAPMGLAGAIPFGPMGAHSRDIGAILRDADVCAYWTATLLEELPTAETIEFARTLDREFGAKTSVVANKSVVLPASEADLERLASDDASSVGEFAAYLLAVSKRQRGFAQTLREAGLDPALAPLVYANDPNEAIERIGEALRNA